MLKFTTDRLELLKVLHAIVAEELTNSKMNVELESEVAEFLTEVTDKRRFRRLKKVRKALNEWIDEIVEEKKKARLNAKTDLHS